MSVSVATTSWCCPGRARCAAGCASPATRACRTARCCSRRWPTAARASSGLAGGEDVGRTRSRSVSWASPSRSTHRARSTVDGQRRRRVHRAGRRSSTAATRARPCGSLAGLLAGRPFLSVLTGDESLVERPMAPRRRAAAGDGRARRRRAPAARCRRSTVRGGDLVGARAPPRRRQRAGEDRAAPRRPAGRPAPPRWSNRRRAATTPSACSPRSARRSPGSTSARCASTAGAPSPFEFDVPGDPSSAAFWVVAATITPGSELVVEGVALNPAAHRASSTCSCAWAPSIEVVVTGRAARRAGGRAAGRRARRCTATTVEGAEIPCVIDEIPVLAVAAACAEGVTEFRDAAELRVKESDRIATVTELLTRLGVGVESGADRLVVRGGRLQPGAVDSHGDHRIAMAARGRRQRGRGRDRGRRAGDRSPRRTPSSPPTSPSLTGRPRREGSSPSTVPRARASRPWPAASPPRSGCPRSTPAPCTAPSRSPRSTPGSTSTTPTRWPRSPEPPTSPSRRGVTTLDGRDVSDEIRGPRGHRRGLAGVGSPAGARGARRPPAERGSSSTAGEWSRAATSAPSCSPTRRSRCSSPPRRGARRAASARRGRGAARGRGRHACATRSTGATRPTARWVAPPGPRTRPPDAVVVDTSDITAEEVIADLVARAQRGLRRATRDLLPVRPRHRARRVQGRVPRAGGRQGARADDGRVHPGAVAPLDPRRAVRCRT